MFSYHFFSSKNLWFQRFLKYSFQKFKIFFWHQIDSKSLKFLYPWFQNSNLTLWHPSFKYQNLQTFASNILTLYSEWNLKNLYMRWIFLRWSSNDFDDFPFIIFKHNLNNLINLHHDFFSKRSWLSILTFKWF